jgi:DNA-binding transcriptional LysR family regulator
MTPYKNGWVSMAEVNLRWDDLKLFLTVYEQGSLSAAARVLKLGQPTLSRRIAELEAAVGEALFVRQSSGVSLTDTGQKLLPAAQRMAEWANEADFSVKKQTQQPAGKVRIAAPPGVAYGLVAPLAAKIQQAYPQIQIELLSAVETLNLNRGEADLSLRTQRPDDVDLVCIDKISCAARVYASQAYAEKQHGVPVNLTDLQWICWAAPYAELLSNRTLNAWIPNFTPVFTSDDFIVQIAACKAGLGAMILPQLLCRYPAFAGLQDLGVDLGVEANSDLYLICHKRHQQLPKVQVVMDFISREFAQLRGLG